MLGRAVPVAFVASLVVVAPASAATLRGSVVAPPAVHGKHAVVPVLVADGRLVKVVVSRRAIATRDGGIAADALRYGDSVTAVARSLRGARTHARALRVGKRGAAPSFRAIAARRRDAIARTTQAADRVGTLAQTTAGIAAVDAEPAVTRARLLDARTQVNYLISDLRDQAEVLEGAVGAAKPVARGKDAQLADLMSTASTARKAADDLDSAVAQLDETINSIGGESAPALPLNGVGAVSDVLHAVLELLRGLPGA